MQSDWLRGARVAVTGASGLLGTGVCETLRAAGAGVVRLGRGANADVRVDFDRGVLSAPGLDGVDAVVHLAGEPVAQRWTAARKRAIRESRVRGTATIARAIAALPRRPRVLVSGSAIGIYGDRGDEILTEQSGAGRDFLAETAVAWEAATGAASDAGVRVVLARSGLVLTPDGGLLERVLPPFRLGLGGQIADGTQWMSWIALPDWLRAVQFLLGGTVSGAVNVVAPEPVTNREFTRALADVLRRPAFARVPAIALRAAFGEMADVAILASQRVAPGRLVDAGFAFELPHLESALRAVLPSSG